MKAESTIAPIIVPIITSIIGGACAIIAAIISTRQKKKIETKHKINWATVTKFIGIIIFTASIGVLVWIKAGAHSKIIITHPLDGTSVDIQQTIRGTYEGIPEGYSIWVLVYPHNAGLFYPQGKPAIMQENNEWSSDAYIGTPDDTGNKFDIVAVLSDKKARDSFIAYSMEEKEKKSWQGLESLPEGTKLLHRITVIRK